MVDKTQLETLINEELSQRQISKSLGCSHTTVRYWLQRYGLKTIHKRRRKHQSNDGSLCIISSCQHHGETEFIWEPSKKGFRCKKCRAANVSLQRRKLKNKLVEKAGGRCVRCGYNKSNWSLHFHHRDPVEKTRDIGLLIRDRKLQPALEEVAKCDLLCANCHGEIEEEKWLEK